MGEANVTDLLAELLRSRMAVRTELERLGLLEEAERLVAAGLAMWTMVSVEIGDPHVLMLTTNGYREARARKLE